MDSFARSHRTVSYSRRYHFPNPCSGDEENYSAQLHADDLSAFIHGLDIELARVVGDSYRASTGLFLAMRHPARVRTLVLGEPPAFPPPILDARHMPGCRENRHAHASRVATAP